MTQSPLPRVSAVSYLNTCPLIWGFLYGPQQHQFDLQFELPSRCADSLESGDVEIGLVPVIEMFRQRLQIVSDVCISSDGPVRSIFLLHRCPAEQIRSVAFDSSSRTSVALTKIILAERYGIQPSEQNSHPSEADATLVIGDPALRLSSNSAELRALDLGAEWQVLTGLPMVYAVWAGRTTLANAALFRESYEYGRARIPEIAQKEAPPRQVPVELAAEYLTRHIRYDLSPRALEGLREFERLANKHGLM